MTKGACALAAALTFSGTTLHADFHTIEITDGAYLPTISYVGRGDDLIFENESDHDHIVSGPNGSWTTGVIPPGGRYIHNINNHMELTFSGSDSEGLEMVGEWSYEPAPLDE
jgi:plastocyanin